VRQGVVRILDRSCAYAQWLMSPRLAWFTATVIIVAMTYAFWLPRTEQRIAHAGALLQLIGTFMGYSALNSTHKLFGMRSLAAEVRAWIGRRPCDVSAELQGSAMAITGGTVTLSTWRAMTGVDADKRIEALIANVEQLRKEACETNVRHENSIAQVRNDLEVKTRAVEAALSGEALKLRESQTGGLWMAAAALLMLLFGTVLAGFPSYFVRSAPASDPEIGRMHRVGVWVAVWNPAINKLPEL
jgi:hypothetical protein